MDKAVYLMEFIVILIDIYLQIVINIGREKGQGSMKEDNTGT